MPLMVAVKSPPLLDPATVLTGVRPYKKGGAAAATGDWKVWKPGKGAGAGVAGLGGGAGGGIALFPCPLGIGTTGCLLTTLTGGGRLLTFEASTVCIAF